MRSNLFALAPALAAAACCGALAAPALAAAQGVPPPPMNVVSLQASASVEVARDWLAVVFSTTREGLDAAAVQAQLRQALDTALAEARKAARPGQVEVQTGAFSLYPRYAPPGVQSAPFGVAGGISGWQGTAELVVEGRDTQAIAQLTGRIQTLSIARVGFSLSREAREKVEADVTAQAIARFRARAEAVTRQFGLASHTVREVVLSSNEAGPGIQEPRRQTLASLAQTEEPLPTEAGKELVTATVSGSVQMAK